MQPVFVVGQQVLVNIGGCVENRTMGVIRSIRQLPTLTTYEVDFADHQRGNRVESFYMADALTPAG